MTLISSFISFDGYGYFVWPAFVFAFISCFYLFIKTRKELIKLEKEFLVNYQQSSKVKIKDKKVTDRIFSKNFIY